VAGRPGWVARPPWVWLPVGGGGVGGVVVSVEEDRGGGVVDLGEEVDGGQQAGLVADLPGDGSGVEVQPVQGGVVELVGGRLGDDGVLGAAGPVDGQGDADEVWLGVGGGDVAWQSGHVSAGGVEGFQEALGGVAAVDGHVDSAEAHRDSGVGGAGVVHGDVAVLGASDGGDGVGDHRGGDEVGGG